MCILFFYANGNPSPGGYKLILASNRDEFYGRPAAALAAWEGKPFAFGGLDMEPGREGGTWLGIGGKNNIIRVGALLNVTGEPKREHGQGRGPIVTDYVTGDKSNEDYSRELINNQIVYNSFNFVTIEIKDHAVNILHCSNAPPSMETWAECKTHGFGNSPPSKSFEKVKHGKELFRKIIDEHSMSDRNVLIEKCMDLLKKSTKFLPDDELLRRAPNWGEFLSAISVRILEAGYGSRTHSVILIDSNNKMDFYEETMLTHDPNGEWKKTYLESQF